MSTNLLIIIKIIVFSLFLSNCGVLGQAEDPLNKDQDLRSRHGDFVYDTIQKSRESSPLSNIFGNSTSERITAYVSF